ncbi:hypothetical protein ACPPVO_50385 [Dactylosporangium sp. McL0621]|uniref:hypothetical protein n=1 Tax=Dactylosporangium sp. McL0621 TaxID=3415678 RepID=UPI003CF69D77
MRAELADEERVAARAPVHGGGDGRRHREPGHGGEVCGDLVLGEPAERDPVDDGLAGERGERVAQRGNGLGVARGDDHDPLPRNVAGEVDEQPQGPRVGPLHVVEEHEQPAAPGPAVGVADPPGQQCPLPVAPDERATRSS